MTREEKIDIYNEVDNFVEENEGEVTNTEIAQHFFELGRNNAINKACDWLDDHLTFNVAEWDEGYTTQRFVDKFRKAMKGGEQ